MRSFLITATPPTTNGDLHAGHLSGPYLAADVFARAQRMLGNQARYFSGGDDHQTYVVTTAERLGVEPMELAARCNREIRETLDLANVSIDLFATPDDGYRQQVGDHIRRLHGAGKLVQRTWSFPFDPDTGRHALEAFATGYCPECLAGTCGAICETCGHPNDVSSLLFANENRPRTEERNVEILVLPLEDYRDRFVDFYDRNRSGMRPHLLRFVEEMLSRPLPDFPVTYPADWGIPIGIEGFEGQVINVWAEMLPALVHYGQTAADPGAWNRDSGWELVQFLGYDNTFYFAFAHLGLIFADGGLVEPTAIITNEFYQLDGAKFSTSRRHLIWARDLVGKYGADVVRFYLALANPEHQEANFIEAEFRRAVIAKLIDPLTTITVGLTAHEGRHVGTDEPPLLARYRARMHRGYTVERFSLRQNASATAHLLALLATRVHTDPDLVTHGLRTAAELAAPLIPAVSQAIIERYAAAGDGTIPDLSGVVPYFPSI